MPDDAAHADRASRPPNPTGGVPNHAPLDGLLRDHVADGLVDYASLGARRGELDVYLAAMASVEPASLPEADALAYHINLYNASMIRAVLDRNGAGGGAGWRPDHNGFAVFKADEIETADGTISLDHLEHEIIRKRYEEPRIHVALVCGARSCPPLVPFAYTGENLEQTLESNMVRFVSDTTRNRIDHEHKTLQLSSIFDWFKEDFGGAEGVVDWVGRYVGRDLDGYRVTYLEYDWTLNASS